MKTDTQGFTDNKACQETLAVPREGADEAVNNQVLLLSRRIQGRELDEGLKGTNASGHFKILLD